MGNLRIRLEASNFFCDHEGVEKIRDLAQTRDYWDFNAALGELPQDKFGSFHVKLTELTLAMIRGGAKGYFWIVISPEVSSLIESTSMFQVDTDFDQIPMGTEEIIEVGVLNRQWRVFVDPLQNSEEVLIGVGDEISNSGHYGVLKLINYIV